MPNTPLAKTVMTTMACALLAGCGLKGPLHIPDTPAAAQRATLPELIFHRQPPAAAGQQEDGPPAAAPQTSNVKP